MSHPLYAQQHHAGELATLVELGIVLPAQVRHAIAGYDAAGQLRAPAVPPPGSDRRAAADAALDLAYAVLGSKRPGVLPALDSGVARIAAARAAEQQARDLALLTHEIRSAAAAVLCQAVTGQNAAKICGSLQVRYREVVTELVERARRLPPGASDGTALEAGGQHRNDYLRARDLAAEAARLRDTLAVVENVPARELPDALELCTMYERSGNLYETAWLARSQTTRYGDLGSFPFWLGAGHEERFEWWLPTAGEVQQRTTELRSQYQARKAAAPVQVQAR